jgi:endonuclease I
MKKLPLLFIALLFSAMAFSQQTGYYNGTEGKSGDELKAALNGIISGHTPYSYFFSKEIFKLSDADPENPDNVIQVYTGFSHDNADYGNSNLQLNREHVWAKSHGMFGDVPPMYGDVHNLKPSAATVNQSKSNLDFDNGGVQHDVATGCYYTDSTWEARDDVKGDVARIIFYMSTRYEGHDGEMDLEVVDWNNTYPNAQHGKLSTLLQWNQMDPPDEFERHRNDVIFQFQKNRNPFIDDPNFAELIWGGGTPNAILIGNIEMEPQVAVANEPVSINATITSTTEAVSSATLLWGLSFESLTNEIEMTADGDDYSAQIPGQAEGATVYYKITATNVETTNASVVYNYFVPKVFNGTIVSIYDIQGQQESSPYEGQVVSTTGIVTANFGSSYFIQDGTGGWNGLFIYESGRNPSIGDSIILTGKISEYYNKTEMSNITDYYFISGNHALPEPVVVTTGNVQEEHESILITVKNASCTDDNYPADHYMWSINDGSGILKVHNTSVFEYEPTEGISYDVTGPVNWDFGEWKIELRFESDVSGGSDEEGPLLVEVTPVISTNVKVMFNEEVEAATAEDVANYSINNGVNIEAATQHAFNKAQINLTVTELSGDYQLTVQNIKDLAGNVMEEQSMEFSFVGIEEVFLNGEAKIFPNPAIQQLSILFTALQNTDLVIHLIDVSGRVVKETNYTTHQGDNNITFGLDNVTEGIYFLNIQSDKYSLRYKVVVR